MFKFKFKNSQVSSLQWLQLPVLLALRAHIYRCGGHAASILRQTVEHLVLRVIYRNDNLGSTAGHLRDRMIVQVLVHLNCPCVDQSRTCAQWLQLLLAHTPLIPLVNT